jgi:hypothetical protein
MVSPYPSVKYMYLKWGLPSTKRLLMGRSQ